ncbi:hypothetical protein [Acidisphaera sp. L21]|uniref:hypothetical protein n=1 Tax=Acidisphaera sp. L21 TaxID=1641851 RepID=UPI0020B11F5E|nr:hypothetical protein [Acidisphaera sp. L21]
MSQSDAISQEEARHRVDAAKVELGERGAPWWTDGSPDYNRKMGAATPYASWFASLEEQSTWSIRKRLPS